MSFIWVTCGIKRDHRADNKQLAESNAIASTQLLGKSKMKESLFNFQFLLKTAMLENRQITVKDPLSMAHSSEKMSLKLTLMDYIHWLEGEQWGC